MAILAGRGYCFGAKAELISTRQLYEVYTAHPVNGNSAGHSWDQSFYFPAGYLLTDLDGTTEALGRYASNADAGGLPVGAAANAVVHTGSGARWAVFGHTLWNAVVSREKRDQILRAADYISENRLPAFIQTPKQAVLLPRENKYKNTVSVSVLNCTIEESGSLDLVVRRPAGTRAVWVSQREASKTVNLPVEQSENGWRLRLPPLGPWEIGTVFME
jgi:hypothetical protein